MYIYIFDIPLGFIMCMFKYGQKTKQNKLALNMATSLKIILKLLKQKNKNKKNKDELVC